jgi:putative PIN family toxin of toxin-antitoxin system
MHPPNPKVVLDTNIVLDLFIFSDPRINDLRAQLQSGHLHWITTQAMRDELERVLTYPHLAARLAANSHDAAHILSQFDAFSQLTEPTPKAPYTCKDPDDQKFIDLAAAHKATLYSKDKAVLTMRRRLTHIGITVLKPT